MNEREMFEEWFLCVQGSQFHLLYGVEGDEEYFYENTQDMWQAWQARAKIDKRNELS